MAKLGRPFSENPKTYRINLRMDERGKNMLDQLCKITRMSKVDTIRYAIEEFYLNKKGE